MVHAFSSASPSLPTLVAWTSTAVLAAAGFINLAAPASVHRAHAREDLSPASYVVVGSLQLLAAGLLLIPAFRLWGITLAALIAFGAVVILLDRGRYVSALPVVLFMVALAAAALSVPPPHEPIHYVAALPVAAQVFS